MTDPTPAAGGLTKAERELVNEVTGNHAEFTATGVCATCHMFGLIREAADREAARVTAAVEALCEPRRCYQCRGTGRQERGESGPLRAVTAPPLTEECRQCRGSGRWEPIGVQTADLRAALSPAGTGALERERAKAYNDAATMAHCYGHTDHWPAEDEPRNPYRAAAVSPEGGGA